MDVAAFAALAQALALATQGTVAYFQAKQQLSANQLQTEQANIAAAEAGFAKTLAIIDAQLNPQVAPVAQPIA